MQPCAACDALLPKLSRPKYRLRPVSSGSCPLLFQLACTAADRAPARHNLGVIRSGRPALHCPLRPLHRCPAAGDQGAAKYHFKIIDYGHAALHGTRTKQRLPRIPFFEVVYRWALGKGDTWRLLHSMINALDGRTWHEAQANQVCRPPFA